MKEEKQHFRIVERPVLQTPSPEYVARLRELERYIPVMTKAEQDQLVAGRTDWPEDTLIKWSGKAAEREAARVELQRRAYARQPALRGEK